MIIKKITKIILILLLIISLSTVFYFFVTDSISYPVANYRCGSNINRGICLDDYNLNSCDFGYIETSTDLCDICCMQTGIKSEGCNSEYPICRTNNTEIKNNLFDSNSSCLSLGEFGKCYRY